MKKLLFSLLIGATSLIAFSSCTKEYITNPTVLAGKTFVSKQTAQDWLPTDEPDEFVLELDYPELDQEYFNYGHVSIAIKMQNAPNIYEIIPARIGNHSYSANYSVGIIRIYSKDVGTGTITKPGNMDVKVTLTDAN